MTDLTKMEAEELFNEAAMEISGDAITSPACDELLRRDNERVMLAAALLKIGEKLCCKEGELVIDAMDRRLNEAAERIAYLEQIASDRLADSTKHQDAYVEARREAAEWKRRYAGLPTDRT